MSFDLYWRPAAPPPPAHVLSDTARLGALASELMDLDHDGTLRTGPVVINKSALAFLRGFLAGLAGRNDEGAKELRADALEIQTAIAHHGSILMWIGNEDD